MGWDGMDGSPGGVRYKGPCSANNGIKKKKVLLKKRSKMLYSKPLNFIIIIYFIVMKDSSRLNIFMTEGWILSLLTSLK